MEDNYKKALWIPTDLHTEIKIFASKNNKSIDTSAFNFYWRFTI